MRLHPPPQRDPRGTDRNRWAAHPQLARGLRLLIRLGPVAAAAAVSRQLGHLLPPASSPHRWWIAGAIVAGSVLAGLATERVTRRLLPLTMLLALPMLFPDRAPSRWTVARRAGRAAVDFRGPDDLAGRSLALLAQATAHDRRTRGHAGRVRVYAEMLGSQLGLSREEADKLRWASLLHDIGTLEVPSTMPNRAGGPTPAEWQVLRNHPAASATQAGPLVSWLGEWGLGIPEHHEKFDGTGYPNGLAGAEISRAGRALAVVDAYEVMTGARSYKRPRSVAEARLELAACAGSHFDPLMVRAFLEISLPRLLWATGPLAFLSNLPFLAGPKAAAGSRTDPVAPPTTPPSLPPAPRQTPLTLSAPPTSSRAPTQARTVTFTKVPKDRYSASQVDIRWVSNGGGSYEYSFDGGPSVLVSASPGSGVRYRNFNTGFGPHLLQVWVVGAQGDRHGPTASTSWTAV